MMKHKLWLLPIIIILLFAFTSCGKEVAADDFVLDFCGAFLNYDYGAMADGLYEKIEPAELEQGFEIISDDVKAKASDITCEIVDSNIRDYNASITVKFTYPDYGSIARTFSNDELDEVVDTYINVLFFDYVYPDVIQDIYMENFSEIATMAEPEIISSEVTFNCVKIDDVWKTQTIDDIDVFLNVLTCNIKSTTEEYYDELKVLREGVETRGLKLPTLESAGLSLFNKDLGNSSNSKPEVSPPEEFADDGEVAYPGVIVEEATSSDSDYDVPVEIDGLPYELIPYQDLLVEEDRLYGVYLDRDDYKLNLRSEPDTRKNAPDKFDNVVGELSDKDVVAVEYIYDDVWAVIDYEGQYVFAAMYAGADINNTPILCPIGSMYVYE